MGLDMYLLRKTYVMNWDSDKPKWNILITKNDKPTHINPKKISYIEEEFGYWRKANAIHQWFVKNVQDSKDDCGTYYVSHEKLAELRDLCQQVLDNNSLATALLPTTSGFFFGSTEYDQYYFEDLQRTVKVCDEALETTDKKDASFYYHSSW